MAFQNADMLEPGCNEYNERALTAIATEFLEGNVEGGGARLRCPACGELGLPPLRTTEGAGEVGLVAVACEACGAFGQLSLAGG